MPSIVAARLAARVGRMTASRSAVVAAVARQRGHFTAEALAAGLPVVGRATVYRTLKILLAAGVLCRVLMDDGSLHYRLSGPGHHHHLVCVACGTIQDFSGCDVNGMANFDKIRFWKTPIGKCPTQAACVPYSRWATDYIAIVGGQ